MSRWYQPLKQSMRTKPLRWIWAPEEHKGLRAGRTDLVLFHYELQVPAEASRVELLVSAEGRYTFWMDEQREAFGRGPARSDPFHRQLDAYEIDLSGGRAPASLTIWAQVRWLAGMPEAPMGEVFSAQPGFFLVARFFDAAGKEVGMDGTTKEWHTWRSVGISGERMTGAPGFLCIGQSEIHRASGWPVGWRSKEAAFEEWAPASPLSSPHFKGDPEEPWSPNGGSWLIERQIAHVEQVPVVIRDLRLRREGREEESLNTAHGVKLAPGEKVTLRCDVGAQTNGHLRLALSGKGTTAVLRCAEVLADEENNKAFTLDSALPLRGFVDRFELDTDSFEFETHHWRALRFMEVVLTAGDAGAEIGNLEILGTGYPFEPDFVLDVQGPLQDEIRKILDVSWRTLKCCTYETYMDCPYYEQMQYVGDTRIQALITYVTTGDPTLPAQALRAFDRSRVYEGLTASRAPGTAPQYIPPFSLIYILMIEDYLEHVGDDALVAELRPGIAPILNWFTRFMDPETTLIGMVDYWPFVDWVQGWDKGISPHGGKANASACANLFYLLALQSAARIYDAAKPGSGNFYAVRATALKQKIYDSFYDAGRGLMCDVPLEAGRGKQHVWSQQAQALAVLAEVLVATEAREALRKSLDERFVLPGGNRRLRDFPVVPENDPRFISPASFYFRFYVAEALAKLRMGELFWPLMQPFREALERGSTVWPESFEPARSECHAWSSWPLYFFARHTLGIAPPSAEDGRIRIRPLHCPPLEVLKGRFQTYKGAVDVVIDWPQGRDVKASGPNVQVMEK